MTDPAQKRIALVTGGNSGIGEAIAKFLAARHFTVVVAGRRQEENERVVDEIASAGGPPAQARTADVSREEDCLQLIRDCQSDHGRLDLLVNNAGIGGKGTLVETTSEDFDRVMKTNLYGPYWCAREAFRLMQEQEPDRESKLRGSILNISSVCGLDAWAGVGMYAASKHGLVGLTRALAEEGGEAGIRVAAICPALVATPMTGVSGDDYLSPKDIAVTVGYLLDLGPAAWPREIALPRRGAE